MRAWLVIDDFHEIAGAPAAEDFVESLLIDAPLNVLLLTRQRPKWASSRRILYGEIFELDRSSLAMSDREAAALLGVRQWTTTSELVDAREGLARRSCARRRARRGSTRPRGARPTFYSFLRGRDLPTSRPQDEAAGSRSWRCTASKDDSSRYNRCRSTRPERVVATGIACGFLTETSDGRLDVHPLVRSFLLLKLREERPRALASIVDRAVRTLLKHRLWDEAFSLIEQFGRDDCWSRCSRPP